MDRSATLKSMKATFKLLGNLENLGTIKIDDSGEWW
jgi:hypothetical protein